jgi:lactoylglutathione lyase
MFSHIMVGVTDFERALAFYKPVLDALGVQFRFQDDTRPWAGWQSAPDPRPLFLIGRPHNQQAHQPGNGQMVAFLAASRRQVDAVHALALANGGSYLGGCLGSGCLFGLSPNSSSHVAHGLQVRGRQQCAVLRCPLFGRKKGGCRANARSQQIDRPGVDGPRRST